MCNEMHGADTIAAVATAPGDGGIAIVRVSGPNARAAFERCFRRAAKGELVSHRMYFGHVVDGDGAVADEAMGVFFQGPRSYTAEDVCELHGHGGQVAARRVLEIVTKPAPDAAAYVRLAEPGEFTKRAFLNGRIDLSEAEAVMALIRSGSEAAARSAVRQMEGGVSRFVSLVRDKLMDLLAAIEAGNDFPEEIEEDATRDEVLAGIAQVRGALSAAADERAARIVRDGLSVVLVGAPNVGKSSLMNALLRQERAIVTNVPGTTRDVLTERLRIGEFVVEISDTAGQRQTGDEVERIGVERALAAEKAADVVVLVLDASREITDADLQMLARADERWVVVLNKSDLSEGAGGHIWQPLQGVALIETCANNGDGIDALIDVLKEKVSYAEAGEGLMTQQRHIECARRALASLDRGADVLTQGYPVDLAAVDLMEALSLMTEITGESATEGVIERIFQQFCVGK